MANIKELLVYRFIALVFIGPYTLYAGIEYQNAMLMLIGIATILVDGILFFRDIGKA